MNFDLAPVKNHRLLRLVCFYAKHSSLFDPQSDHFSVFTAEITKVRSHIKFCAAGGSFRPIGKRARKENPPLILRVLAETEREKGKKALLALATERRAA